MIDVAAVRLGEEAARRLARMHPSIKPGLTAAEFDRIEREFGFTFADDHRAFLSAGLPVGGPQWPDWRDGDRETLRATLDRPVDGVLLDVEHNGYWHRDWGDRSGGVDVARQHLASVPRMVPVYSHRYLTEGRGTHGHPVLSRYQTDIIFYGADLLDYVCHEFRLGPRDPERQPRATVPFRRDLVE